MPNPIDSLRAAMTRRMVARTTRVGEHAARALASVQAFLDELDRHPQDRLVPRLSAAKQHLLRAPGKMVRPLVVSLLGRSLGVPDEKTRPYALSVELIHTASLLHDDVIDRADTRRHRPTANAAYDNTLPILAGDGILAEVMERVAALGDVAAIQAIAATIQDLVAGEAWQYELAGTVHDDVQICLEVAELKTGALLSFCTWVPAHLAGLPDAEVASYAAIGRYTGVAFQLIDDVLDFDAAETGKPALGDWCEGKTNAMTAALCAAHPAGRPGLETFFAAARREGAECARRLSDLFPPAAVAEARKRTLALAEEYATLADHHARRVPDNPAGRLFEELRRMLLARKS
jgi:geranylgeranyl pyrophosphate synthase